MSATTFATVENGMRIYKNANSVDIPVTDLPSFLFDSEHSLAQDDTPLHVSAANPTIFLTKATLRALAERIAHFLRTTFAVGAQGPYKDVVVMCSSLQPAAPAAFWGVIAAGGVFSAASHSFTPGELARQITHGKSRVLIVTADKVDVGRKAAEIAGLSLDRVVVLESEPTWGFRALDGGKKTDVVGGPRLAWRRVTEREEQMRSLVVLLYSSGTTGVPKGVMLSHYNLVAQLFVPNVHARQHVASSLARGEPAPSPMRTLAHVPVAHIAGVAGYFLVPMYANGTVYWMGKFVWADFLRYFARYKLTTLFSVPSIYLRIAKDPAVTDQFSHVEVALCGAAPMDAELQSAASRKLGGGKVKLAATWGLSETTGSVTGMPRGASDSTGSLSPVLPNMSVRLVDASFADVAPGHPGELLVRGPFVTNGYFCDAGATAAAFHDGWFLTGDVAVERGGKLYIVDRKKELIKYKGLQIAPAELEGVLAAHEGIEEAAVVGVEVEGEKGSEVPRAYVVRREGWGEKELGEEDVRAWVEERVARYKWLRGGVRFVDEVPKNAVGKILRRELRERARGEGRGGRARL